jgi:hypothetical protein
MRPRLRTSRVGAESPCPDTSGNKAHPPVYFVGETPTPPDLELVKEKWVGISGREAPCD